MFVQVILGILTVKLGKLEFTQSHALNGFAGMIAIAVIYLNLTQRKDMTYLLYGIGSLFIMGLGIKAMLVGQVG